MVFASDISNLVVMELVKGLLLTLVSGGCVFIATFYVATFYTSEADGNGLGLLSLKTWAKEHKVTIQVLDSYMGGTCFTLSFPVP